MFDHMFPKDIKRPTRATSNWGAANTGDPNCLQCRHSKMENDFSMVLVHCVFLQDGEFLDEFQHEDNAIEFFKTHACDVLRNSPKHED